MSYPHDDDYEGVETAFEEWLDRQHADPCEDAGDYYDDGDWFVECPRGHEYDCEKDDVCPRCLDDADKWMDAERDA